MTIKPLRWKRVRGKMNLHSEARTPFYTYQLYADAECKTVEVCIAELDYIFIGVAGSIKAAKQKAEEHWRKKVQEFMKKSINQQQETK